MEPIDKLDDLDYFEQELFQQYDPLTTKAERIQNNMDATYAPADLEKITAKCSELNSQQQSQLLGLMQRYNYLFDGTLGTWKTELVDLALNDPDCKPYHAKPYPVPHSQEEKLKEECQRLCSYGILKRVNNSE